MKANTALGLALGGAALARLGSAAERASALPAALGGTVLALGALTFIEHVGGFDFGIDELLFRDSATTGDKFPGRMSLATSLGFVLAGSALLALWRASTRAAYAAAASGLGLGVAVLGIVALAGYTIRLEMLYALYAFGTVAIHTAAAFVVLGLGILLEGRARLPAVSEDLRIAGLAASLLALAAAASGLAAFSTLQSIAERSIAEGVSLALAARIAEIGNTIDLRTVRAETVTTRPNMLRFARVHAEQPANAEARAVVQNVLESFRTHGFSGVAVSDPGGEAYARWGSFVESPVLEVELASQLGATLLWKNGFYLRNRLPLRDAMGPLGAVLAEQPLPNVDEALRAVQSIGESAELLICKSGADRFSCFPSRLSPAAPIFIPVSGAAGPAQLVHRAASSGKGFDFALDHRGRRVLGAFAPVGASGVVAVLKVDAEEIYAPLAIRFQFALLLIAALVAGGALVVYARVRPLASALEQRVRERTVELERAREGLARQAERLRIVHDIDRALIAEVDVEAIAAAVLQPLRELLGVPRVVVNLFDLAAGEVEWLAAAGRHRTRVGPGVRYSIRLMGDVAALRRGEPQRIETRALPPGPEVDALLASGVHVYMAVPMIAGGELIGALSFGGEQDAFPEEQVTIAREVATQLAIAITQARLFERVKRQAEELEQKVHERTAQLEKTGRELADLYDRAPCGYHSVDGDGRIVRINQTWLDWLGRTREEVIGRMHPELMTPESAEQFRTKWFPLFRKQGWLKEIEFEYVRKDGSTFPALISGSSIYDKDGKFLVSRSTVTDITARKRIEVELHQLNAKLLAANEELEGFSYSVSHDLRAPLRAVDGYALMLQEDYAARLDVEGKRLLGVIRGSAAQMGRLIDDLLKFSQVGRKPLASAPLDMRALAAESIGELSPAYPTVRVELRDLPVATGDRALLKHVWMNLIGNALKYSARSDAARVEISGRVKGAENVYSVRDDGAGFDMRYYDKLFKVFQRLHGEEEFEGTGVGLAIVQRVVIRHGGRVWGEGAVGKGACFSFALPREV